MSIRLRGGILCATFSFEAVYLVHVVCFVVAAVDMDAFWVENFEGVEEESDFCRPGPTINKVAVEEVVVGFRGEAISLEDFQYIIELSCC